MKEELKKLGLTENESKIYLAMLELGSINAGEIIKKTKLHRNIVYDNLDKLIERSLVTFVIIKNIKYFEVSPSTELKAMVEKEREKVNQKESILNQIIPKINELKKKSKRKQEATIFKGKKGLKTILEEISKSKTEIFVFGTGWGMNETMGSYYEQWHLKLKENKIIARILLPENKRKLFLKPFTARYLSEKEIIPSTIAVYEDKVLNIVWDEDPIAILIINERIAKSYKTYFMNLWRTAKI